MIAACIGTPISWLELELYADGAGSDAERAEIRAHIEACEACRSCLETIETDTRALPPLVLPEPRAVGAQPVDARPLDARPAGARTVWLRRAPKVGAALALAAGLLFVFGGLRGRRQELASETSGERGSRTKGATIGFVLVRDDDVELGEGAGVYRDGERFKARVTCPPDMHAGWDLVVLDRGEASFPLAPAADMACGNGVFLPGAFRLVGRDPMTVCVVHREGGLVDRNEARRADPSVGPDAVCKVLTPAP